VTGKGCFNFAARLLKPEPQNRSAAPYNKTRSANSESNYMQGQTADSTSIYTTWSNQENRKFQHKIKSTASARPIPIQEEKHLTPTQQSSQAAWSGGFVPADPWRRRRCSRPSLASFQFQSIASRGREVPSLLGCC